MASDLSHLEMKAKTLSACMHVGRHPLQPATEICLSIYFALHASLTPFIDASFMYYPSDWLQFTITVIFEGTTRFRV